MLEWCCHHTVLHKAYVFLSIHLSTLFALLCPFPWPSQSSWHLKLTFQYHKNNRHCVTENFILLALILSSLNSDTLWKFYYYQAICKLFIYFISCDCFLLHPFVESCSQATSSLCVVLLIYFFTRMLLAKPYCFITMWIAHTVSVKFETDLSTLSLIQ